MRTPESTDAHIASLQKAHDCFALMLKKGPVTATLQTTQKLLKELEKFRIAGQQANNNSTGHQTRSEALANTHIHNMHGDSAHHAVPPAAIGFTSFGDDDSFTYTNYELDDFVFVPNLDNYFKSSLEAFM